MTTLTDLCGKTTNLIFCLLSPKEIAACRAVCLKWRNVVDQLTRKSRVWRVYCRRDYGYICDSAHRKLRRGLTWYHLYKSLALWSLIPQARDTIEEFAEASGGQDVIKTFNVLACGEIGVLRKNTLHYYNIHTSREFKKHQFDYDCRNYHEGNDWIIIIDQGYRVLVYTKSTMECVVNIPGVYFCLCINKSIYLVPRIGPLFIFDIVNKSIATRNPFAIMFDTVNEETLLLRQPIRYIQLDYISLGYKIGDDRLFILHTLESNVAVLTEHGIENAALHYTIDQNNFLRKLRRFNFLEQMDWKNYHEWAGRACTNLFSWHGIVYMCGHGNILIVAYAWRMLSIYQLQRDADFNYLIHTMPLKEFHLFEYFKFGTQILKIDVVEDNNAHIVLVAVPEKIIKITIDHGFLDLEESDSE